MLAQLMSDAIPSSRPNPEPSGVDLTRLCSQDVSEFRRFVSAHQRQVFGLVSRLTGHGAHVDDVAQETFLRAYRALPSFDPNGSAKISTWLLTIATNLSFDERRKRRPNVELDEAKNFPTNDTPERAHDRTQLRLALERAARELPDDQCAALVLAEFHGQPIREIAEILGVPESTVKTRLFRAREKMKLSLHEFRMAGSRP